MTKAIVSRSGPRTRALQLFLPRLAATALLALYLCLYAFDAAAQAPQDKYRFATFNIAMGLDEPGELRARLEAGDDERLRQLAEVLQDVRPDVILINEFDYLYGVDQAALLNDNYLAVSQAGQAPIRYEYSFATIVNTGLDSGFDLDRDGIYGEPEDALGYGAFPGQYGMLVLSRFPIIEDDIRTFRNFKWADMPAAQRPFNPDGTRYWDNETWRDLPLSSKSHWDIPIKVDRFTTVQLLASHPTPPAFDGPERRNAKRNHDEIRFWVDYVTPGRMDYIYDDNSRRGGLARGHHWVLAGDLNADPFDGNSLIDAADRLLDSREVNSSCVPSSTGGQLAARAQGGANLEHRGNPAHDTADFNDVAVGNLRVDYVLTGRRSTVLGCGVFWPVPGLGKAELVEFSDHRLVWMDLAF